MTTDRLQAGENGSVQHTITNPGTTRAGADITNSLLEMKTTIPSTELCRQKCRRIRQASISHNQPGMLNIHQGIGGGSTTVWRDGNPGQCLVPVRPVLEYQYVLAVIREQTICHLMKIITYIESNPAQNVYRSCKMSCFVTAKWTKVKVFFE